MSDALVVLVTVPDAEKGDELAGALVEEGLAACVNRMGPIVSTYRWQEEICRDQELLLVIKTDRAHYEALESRVQALHPYDVPEVIALPVERGSAGYLSWITEQLR